MLESQYDSPAADNSNNMSEQTRLVVVPLQPETFVLSNVFFVSVTLRHLFTGSKDMTWVCHFVGERPWRVGANDSMLLYREEHDLLPVSVASLPPKTRASRT